MDYDKMSDSELYALLKERVPAVAETVGEVGDSNRQTLIAFLKFLSDEPGIYLTLAGCPATVRYRRVSRKNDHVPSAGSPLKARSADNECVQQRAALGDSIPLL